MKPQKRKLTTAAELLAALQSDSEWVRQNDEREAHFRGVEQQLASEEKPILDDLAEVGCEVNSVWDLVNSGENYSAVIPVLSKHLQGSYNPRILEGIIRALTVPDARGVAARQILDELERRGDESPSELRWALANALAVVADKSMVDEIKGMAADPRYEDVHERLKLALEKSARRTTNDIPQR
jgi:hypothetical protein